MAPQTGGGGATVIQSQTGLVAQFQICQKLGSGSFGVIYRGKRRKPRSGAPNEVAIKAEQIRKGLSVMLRKEAEIYQVTHQEPGVPFMEGYEETKGESAFLVMELLGKSLESYFLDNHKRLASRTVIKLAPQMIERAESLHRAGYIHRDIKPENFMLGHPSKDPKMLYIIDFGLAKRFVDSNGRHNRQRQGLPFVGTTRYCSTNTLLGYECSRRDDIESIAYALIYLLRGSMPWSGVDAKTKQEKFEKIVSIRRKMSLSELCKGMPPAIPKLLQYSQALKFEEKPDYAGLIQLFEECYESFKFDDTERDGCPVIDWSDAHKEEKGGKEKKKSLPGRIKAGISSLRSGRRSTQGTTSQALRVAAAAAVGGAGPSNSTHASPAQSPAGSPGTSPDWTRPRSRTAGNTPNTTPPLSRENSLQRLKQSLHAAPGIRSGSLTVPGDDGKSQGISFVAVQRSPANSMVGFPGSAMNSPMATPLGSPLASPHGSIKESSSSVSEGTPSKTAQHGRRSASGVRHSITLTKPDDEDDLNTTGGSRRTSRGQSRSPLGE